MSLQHLRVRLRRMLVTSFLVTLVLPACDETYYMATKSFETAWPPGSSAKVVVDNFKGGINVAHAIDDKVKAHVALSVVTKQSQEAADRAIKAIQVMMTRQGDAIWITAKVDPKYSTYPVLQPSAQINLYVPPGVRLDLHTHHGDIHVGQVYAGGSLVKSPPVVSSIIAKADFDGSD